MPVMTEKRSLSGARLQAGFERQVDLAMAANIAISVVWMGENSGSGFPPERKISFKSASKILKVLEQKGVNLAIEDLDWRVGIKGKNDREKGR